MVPYQPKTSRRKTQASTTSNNQQHNVPARASPMDNMYDKLLIQQRVVYEMQDLRPHRYEVGGKMLLLRWGAHTGRRR
jgi:hypothetical protein